jgi:PBP1b-binding outer membrane lipoprotein LpoB
MKKLATLLVLLSVGLFTVGCETTEPVTDTPPATEPAPTDSTTPTDTTTTPVE